MTHFFSAKSGGGDVHVLQMAVRMTALWTTARFWRQKLNIISFRTCPANEVWRDSLIHLRYASAAMSCSRFFGAKMKIYARRSIIYSNVQHYVMSRDIMFIARIAVDTFFSHKMTRHIT